MNSKMAALGLGSGHPRPTAAAAKAPSPLGTLEKLPTELRCMIFEHCIANHSVSGILRASKQLHSEFRSFLYEEFELAFHIDPANTAGTVRILNFDHDTVDCLSNHRDHSSIIEKTPFHRFKAIRVSINAPDPEDPGQMVRCWKQCPGLMQVLLPVWGDADRLPESSQDFDIHAYGYQWVRKIRRLPPITIEFVDKGERKWALSQPGSFSRVATELVLKSGVCWNHGVPSYNERDDAGPNTVPGNIESSDVDILIKAFQRIRCADSVRVKLPPWTTEIDNEFLEGALRNLNRLAKIEHPFGIILTPSDVIGVHTAMSRQDTMHLWLEYLLDDLDGPAAALLRRQRYGKWCSEYEHLHFQRLNGFHTPNYGGHHLGGPWGEMSPGLIAEIEAAFRARFAAGMKYLEEIELRLGEKSSWEISFPSGVPRRSEDNKSWQNGVKQEDDDYYVGAELEPLRRGIFTNTAMYGPVSWEQCQACADAELQRLEFEGADDSENGNDGMGYDDSW